jgi:hypothetical protein
LKKGKLPFGERLAKVEEQSGMTPGMDSATRAAILTKRSVQVRLERQCESDQDRQVLLNHLILQGVPMAVVIPVIKTSVRLELRVGVIKSQMRAGIIPRFTRRVAPMRSAVTA